MTNLLEHDHRELDALLDKVFAAFDDGGGAERVWRSLDFFWARLAMHIRAEHLHLFPALASAPATRNIIEELKADHDFFMRELASAMKRLRALPEADKTDASGMLLDLRERIFAVRRRLAAHNELEEEKIYRLIGERLVGAKRAELDGKMKAELENLPPRFSRPEAR